MNFLNLCNLRNLRILFGSGFARLGLNKDYQVTPEALSQLTPRDSYFSQFIRYTNDEIRACQKFIEDNPDAPEGKIVSYKNDIDNLGYAQKFFQELFPENIPDTSDTSKK